MKMNVYQKISQIIKEADGILIGASNGLSIAEGYNIFADDAWFQENMGDFREKYGLRCVLHGFSVPMKVEEKWAFVSRLVKAKAMQDEPSEIMKNIYALVKDKEYFVVTSNAEDHFVPAGFEADRVFEMEGKLTQMRCKSRCHDEVYPNQKAVLAMTEEEVNGRVPKELLPKCPKCGGYKVPALAVLKKQVKQNAASFIRIGIFGNKSKLDLKPSRFDKFFIISHYQI